MTSFTCKTIYKGIESNIYYSSIKQFRDLLESIRRSSELKVDEVPLGLYVINNNFNLIHVNLFTPITVNNIPTILYVMASEDETDVGVYELQKQVDQVIFEYLFQDVNI